MGHEPGAKGNLIGRDEAGENERFSPERGWLHDYPDIGMPVYRSSDYYHFVVAGAKSAEREIVCGGKKAMCRRIEE